MDSEDLATLELATDDKKITLSYAPSKAAAPMDLDGIVIHGRGYILSVSEMLADDEPISIRVTRDNSNLPVKRLALIFMPDTGPFVRVVTDSEGHAELPIPEQSGTLRIQSGIPHVLHIKINK